MKIKDIPIGERYSLSVREAAAYFGIGENKLRKILSEHRDSDFLLYNGNRTQIKRKKFEAFLDKTNLI